MIEHCLTCFNEQNITCAKCEEGYELKNEKECAVKSSKAFLIGLIIAGSMIFIGAGIFIGLKLYFTKKTKKSGTDSLLEDQTNPDEAESSNKTE